MEGLPVGQRASAWDVFHPTAVRNKTLLSHHVIKVAGIELGEAILLGDMDLKVGTMRFIVSKITAQKA